MLLLSQQKYFLILNVFLFVKTNDVCYDEINYCTNKSCFVSHNPTNRYKTIVSTTKNVDYKECIDK